MGRRKLTLPQRSGGAAEKILKRQERGTDRNDRHQMSARQFAQTGERQTEIPSAISEHDSKEGEGKQNENNQFLCQRDVTPGLSTNRRI